MTHQGDPGLFEAAARRGAREAATARMTAERSDMSMMAPPSDSAPRGDLNAAPLRPCRLEGKLYE